MQHDIGSIPDTHSTYGVGLRVAESVDYPLVGAIGHYSICAVCQLKGQCIGLQVCILLEVDMQFQPRTRRISLRIILPGKEACHPCCIRLTGNVNIVLLIPIKIRYPDSPGVWFAGSWDESRIREIYRLSRALFKVVVHGRLNGRKLITLVRVAIHCRGVVSQRSE